MKNFGMKIDPVDLAQAFYSAKPSEGEGNGDKIAMAQWKLCVRCAVAVLQKHNSYFSPVTFLLACGLIEGD